jgi:hypothetical protein
MEIHVSTAVPHDRQLHEGLHVQCGVRDAHALGGCGGPGREAD